MSTSQPERDEQGLPPKSPSTAVLLTIADTTWRMFVPSVGFTLAGLWLDGKMQTTPWLMFAGIIFGLLIAVLAVKLQLKRLN
jgi:hypothetical protein